MSDQVEEIPMAQESGKNRPLIETVNVLDGRIAGCTDQLNFGVEKGGMNVTAYAQRQSSVSTAGASFVVTVPTMSTIIDRVVYVRSEVTFAISGVPTNAETVLQEISGTAGTGAASLKNIAPAPFPFHHLCQNIQATVNQQSFSFDCRQQLPMLMKMLDKEVLNKYCSMCPTQQDVYADYDEVTNRIGINNPFQGIGQYIEDQLPRGAFVSQMSVVSDSAAQGAAPAALSLTAKVKLVIYEPLLMSPFLLNSSSGGENSQGLYGVQNMRFLMNFASGSTRALRIAKKDSAGNPYTVTIDSVSNDTFLDFIMLTPHPSQAKSLVSRNAVPYLDTMRYTTVLTPASQNISNSVQLSHIPDKVLVCIRKTLDSQTSNDADAFLPIDEVQISFANRNGILAGTKRHQLYEMSRANGCHQSWLEYYGVGYENIAVGSGNKNLAGSVLCLAFGKDIAITEDYYAAGSLGQFNFYIQCNLDASALARATAASYELVLVFVNSGLLVNEMGSTSIYTGLLTKQQVLDAANKPTVNRSVYNRYLGGGWWSSVKSAFKKARKYVKPIATAVKHVSGVIPHPGAQALSKTLGALGAGNSGSGYSGGRFY
jgi:hypothetical protein